MLYDIKFSYTNLEAEDIVIISNLEDDDSYGLNATCPEKSFKVNYYDGIDGLFDTMDLNYPVCCPNSDLKEYIERWHEDLVDVYDDKFIKNLLNAIEIKEV